MTPWTAARQDSLSITNSQSLLKLMSIKLVMPSKHLNLCCPLLLPSIFPSIEVSSNQSVLCSKRTNYWSFSFTISPSSEYPRLISFRIDWFDLFAVQGTLQSVLQHHSSKPSMLPHSTFLMVHLAQMDLMVNLSSGLGFPGGSEGKGSPRDAGNQGLILRSGRSPGEGNGNAIQYSFLENSMDRGVW